MRGLNSKNAIVTGAARGIGLAIAERLSSEGCNVMLLDVSPDVAAAAERLGQRHALCDMSDETQIRKAFDSFDEGFGHLDILVNNAGILSASARIEGLVLEDFDRVMKVNLRGPLVASQEAARRMIPRRSGSIVNVASIAAALAVGEQIPYSVSKAALRQLTAASALSLAKHNIRVNAVGPGTIETAMTATADPKLRELVLLRTPLGRLGRCEEIAATVAFLASDEASYITGQIIFADGGRLVLNYVADPQEDS